MSNKEEQVVVALVCNECGGKKRNHHILSSHKERYGEPDDHDYDYGYNTYNIVKCGGCDTIRFRHSSTHVTEYDENGHYYVTEKALYPDGPSFGRQAEKFPSVPHMVEKMYLETIKVLNVGALTLAGGGLRAIVEAICKERQVANDRDPLEKKIDKLVEKGYLVQTQADLLHEERYIGNAALHELETPKRQDIEDGLKIIEGLMTTIYELPERAKRLKEKREKREASPQEVNGEAGAAEHPGF